MSDTLASLDQRRLLRHFLAAIAYRTAKALRGAPEGFGDFRAGPGVRTPRQLVRHMSSVLGYAGTLFTGGTYRARSLDSLEAEVARLHRILEELAARIDQEEFSRVTPDRLLQGPLADAMTHAGQLAMLRRLAGSPVAPENFVQAEIDPERLGPDQAAPADPDRVWYDAEEEPW